MRQVTLRAPTDFAGFRSAARRLLAADVPPEQVSWSIVGDSGQLFGADAPAEPDTSPLNVSRAFLTLARRVMLHRDPARFALLYRVLWRLRSEPRLLELEVDPDVARLNDFAKSVARDIHKMHAFVRFREVPGATASGQPLFVAWFEPTHHIVETASQFFVRRFPNRRWAILTPEVSAHWDGEALRFGPGARRQDAPADDATESLWRAYYASIFNPARLKPGAMRAEMPKKYWRNLPESTLIPGLVAAASAREREMVEHSVTPPARRRAPLRDPASRSARGDALDRLRESAARCRSCPLFENATQTVFGTGPRTARVMLVGEQPGDQEDLRGEPFVGPAGKLLDNALGAAGIDRKRLYLTNAVKHFKFEPRGKRRLHKTPAQSEIEACGQWLEQEIATIRPRLVVALGATAARAVVGKPLPVQKSRGTIFKSRDAVTGEETDLLVTVHPSYLLRLDDARREAELGAFIADLELIKPYVD